MKVLIVEDDKMLAKMYHDGFKHAGHSVVIADSAQTALNKLDKTKVDLILLDMILPGRSGVEVLHELNSYVDWQQIPVILMSDSSRERMKISDLNLEKYSVKKIIYKPNTTPAQIVKLSEKFANETV